MRFELHWRVLKNSGRSFGKQAKAPASHKASMGYVTWWDKHSTCWRVFQQCLWFTALMAVSSHGATAQTVRRYMDVGQPCAELYRSLSAQLVNSTAREAERLVSALASNAGNPANLCVGLILHNIALRMSGSGRLAEAEAFGAQSVATLEKTYPSDDPLLFWPLQVLAAVQVGEHKTASASKTFRKMLNIRTQDPDQRAAILDMRASLLKAEGRGDEAEQAYLAALRIWADTGRGHSLDAGGVLNSLAVLYLDERRLEEAERTLDRALPIFRGSKDAVPMDYINFLNSHGVLHGRKGEWRQAEQDLGEAISMAGRESRLNPLISAQLLGNYAIALRKNHQRRKAQVIEARLKALQPETTQESAVVDISELLAKSRGGEK